jgi:hypothetical protein
MASIFLKSIGITRLLSRQRLPSGSKDKTMPRYYRCQNSDCRSEMEIIKPSPVAIWNPKCACGAEMKRFYVKPTVKRLDLAPDDLLVEAPAKKKQT